MKPLFNLVKNNLKTAFGDKNRRPYIKTVQLDNNQLSRLDELEAFSYPAVFFNFNLPDWIYLTRGVRYAVVSFDLVYVYESYNRMEDELEIDEDILKIKNVITNSHKREENSPIQIGQPWVVNEFRGDFETNLMTYTLTFETNYTDFTGKFGVEAEIDKINIYIGKWLLENGSFADDGVWIDSAQWDDGPLILKDNKWNDVGFFDNQLIWTD
jgi:hypothetical protein